MSTSGKFLLLPILGITLFIVGCSNSNHNTALTGDQTAEVGTEIEANTFANLGTAFDTKVKLAPAVAKGNAAPVAIQPDCTPNSGSAGGENCTIPSTTFNCITSGTFAISGTFSDVLDTTTLIDTVDLTNLQLAPSACTVDNLLIVTGTPSIVVTGTGLKLDESTSPPDIELPFTVHETGHVSFTKGPANTDSTFPASGHCDLNVVATFEQVPSTSTPPLQVQAAVSGTICGKTIPANTAVFVGSF